MMDAEDDGAHPADGGYWSVPPPTGPPPTGPPPVAEQPTPRPSYVAPAAPPAHGRTTVMRAQRPAVSVVFGLVLLVPAAFVMLPVLTAPGGGMRPFVPLALMFAFWVFAVVQQTRSGVFLSSDTLTSRGFLGRRSFDRRQIAGFEIVPQPGVITLWGPRPVYLRMHLVDGQVVRLPLFHTPRPMGRRRGMGVSMATLLCMRDQLEWWRVRGDA